MAFIVSFTGFFQYPPSSGIAPCVGTAGTIKTPALDTALLSADLGRTVDSRVYFFSPSLLVQLLV